MSLNFDFEDFEMHALNILTSLEQTFEDNLEYKLTTGENRLNELASLLQIEQDPKIRCALKRERQELFVKVAFLINILDR